MCSRLLHVPANQLNIILRTSPEEKEMLVLEQTVYGNQISFNAILHHSTKFNRLAKRV